MTPRPHGSEHPLAPWTDRKRQEAEARVAVLEGETEKLKRQGREWVSESLDREEALENRMAGLVEALKVAADDLDKAANQFASMRESQEAGHNVQIRTNPEKFAEKADRARRALRGSVPAREDNDE